MYTYVSDFLDDNFLSVKNFDRCMLVVLLTKNLSVRNVDRYVYTYVSDFQSMESRVLGGGLGSFAWVAQNGPVVPALTHFLHLSPFFVSASHCCLRTAFVRAMLA